MKKVALTPFSSKQTRREVLAEPTQAQKTSFILAILFYLASIFLLPVVLLPVMGVVEWVVSSLNPAWATSTNETALLVGLLVWTALTLTGWGAVGYQVWKRVSRRWAGAYFGVASLYGAFTLATFLNAYFGA